MNGKIITDLHIKATDHHQYLHYISLHPYHTKRSRVHIEALRFSWICSFEQDFESHRNQMKLWFLNRGYHKWLIDKEMETVKFPWTLRKRDNKMKGILLVITYHPFLKNFASVIKKHFIFSIWVKKLKKSLLLVPWFHSEGQENWEAILLRLNCTP